MYAILLLALVPFVYAAGVEPVTDPSRAFIDQEFTMDFDVQVNNETVFFFIEENTPGTFTFNNRDGKYTQQISRTDVDSVRVSIDLIGLEVGTHWVYYGLYNSVDSDCKGGVEICASTDFGSASRFRVDVRAVPQATPDPVNPPSQNQNTASGGPPSSSNNEQTINNEEDILMEDTSSQGSSLTQTAVDTNEQNRQQAPVGIPAAVQTVEKGGKGVLIAFMVALFAFMIVNIAAISYVKKNEA